MKHLLACLAILAAFNVTAQVDGFQLPYNPDSEPDGYIGVGDILEVLSIFGSQFSPDDIYTNDDSTHIVMNVGSMTYPECEYTCQFTLPGSWRVATIADAGGAWPEIMNDFGWINQIDGTMGRAESGDWRTHRFGGGSGAYKGDEIKMTQSMIATGGCYCATQERPKVELSSCTSCDQIGAATPTALDIQSCVDLKVQDGWYPLGGVSASGAICINQVFWRWAD